MGLQCQFESQRLGPAPLLSAMAGIMWTALVTSSAAPQATADTGTARRTTGSDGQKSRRRIQGPDPNDKTTTKGRLHPNARGHQEYATQLTEAILPDLFPTAPPSPPPIFSTVDTNADGTLKAEQSPNGWFTRSCLGQTCDSTHVVQTVMATDSAGDPWGQRIGQWHPRLYRTRCYLYDPA